MESGFDLERFYARVEATVKERAPLRQALVRGLKDWHTHLDGYDRYGAETAFLLRERLHVPRIFGFAVLRILRDRRISSSTKTAAARLALDAVAYGQDMGVPHGLLEPVAYLHEAGVLSLTDLRFALIVSTSVLGPFDGVERGAALRLMRALVERVDMPAQERTMWAHALLVQHRETAGMKELITTVLEAGSIPIEVRRELCWAWVHGRQPRFEIAAPAVTAEPRSAFVAEHLPFWVRHVRSWPAAMMVRRGLFALSLLGEDPLTLAQSFMGASGPYEEQLHAGVADIIAYHAQTLPPGEVQAIIETGTRMTGSAATRRRFYALGADILTPEYVDRAADDTAGSVRQWAARRREKGINSPETLSLTPGDLD